MSFLSWLSATGKKSAAAAVLQTYYEICKRHGAFRGDPAAFANRILERACDKLPSLTEGNPKPYVLALAALTVLMVDEPQQSSDANLYAMGIGAMIKALDADPSFVATPSEARIIEASAAVISRWMETPSPWLTGMGFDDPGQRRIDPGPITTAHPPPEQWAEQSPRDRERARAELVRRMQESGGRS